MWLLLLACPVLLIAFTAHLQIRAHCVKMDIIWQVIKNVKLVLLNAKLA